MKPFLRFAELASAVALPILLGCFSGGAGDGGLVTGPPSGAPLAFQYFGPTQVVANSYGDVWQIFTNPQVFGGNKIHFTGQGTLTDLSRNPLDLSLSNLPAQGFFVPPATVPPGGTTVTLSMEAYWTPTQQWIQSPTYTIQVVQQTIPMVYRLGTNPDGTNSPSAITLHPGQTSDAASGALAAWWIYIHPWPLDPRPQFQLSSSQPPGTDLGSVNLVRPLDGQNWTFNFVAPSVITSPFDVNVRATLHDPWFNLDPYVDFTVHLVPN